MKKKTDFQIKGLRKRWLVNTVSVVSILGIACVLIIVAAFSAYYYSSLESDMRDTVESVTEEIVETGNQEKDAIYQSYITYIQRYNNKGTMEMQFVNQNKIVEASSQKNQIGSAAATDDVLNAISNRVLEKFVGRDPSAGKRIMAFASPIIDGNDEVIGVFRLVSSTENINRQVVRIALISLTVFLVVILVVLFSSNYYIRSILVPLGDIIDKAKKITGGSYGIQIQKKYDDEIGDLADTINEMSIKINQNEKMQTEFISSLSHELRTPLTAITGWSETLLNSDDLSPDTRRGMRIIHREAGRLTEMVLDLLDFTRIQDGRMTLNMETVDIRAEFEDTIFMYGNRLSNDGIELEYIENDDDIPLVSCDPKRLRQVFLNILDNAAKHGSDGKRIEASISRNGENILVSIRDYGPGIPEDELHLVKKKFYKGSSKARGSGIGLAVCDEIVILHGGTLSLNNAPEGGTVVTVEFPIMQ